MLLEGEDIKLLPTSSINKPAIVATHGVLLLDYTHKVPL